MRIVKDGVESTNGSGPGMDLNDPDRLVSTMVPAWSLGWINAMIRERRRQNLKFPDQMQRNSRERWMTILGEEYGETCKEVMEASYAEDAGEGMMVHARLMAARGEAIETAAVAVAFVEAIDLVTS